MTAEVLKAKKKKNNLRLNETSNRNLMHLIKI